ncbi:hypothetical protein HYT26_02445 [Candidatus Pacearchaeota archaeon]|nr:hypothetical protein [Candidatus Pacearchaeota archaeon]
MVKTIKAYECEICGNRSFDKKAAIKHETKKTAPKYKISEEVEGHYVIGKINEEQYVFTSFKVLGYRKKGHSFNYTLEPQTIQAFRPPCAYTSPIIFRGKSGWKAETRQKKAIIKSLESKLSLQVIIREDEIRKMLVFG